MSPFYRLHYAPDNASLVVRLALEDLAVPYVTALVDRAARGQKAPAYLRLNPAGLIPVLETPDGAIFETGAILLWLADRHGRLAPGIGSPDRAGFLKWLFFVSNTLHPAMRMTFYPEQYIGPHGDHSRLHQHMQGAIAGHLDKLDALAGQAPAFFAGARPTVLDYYVGPLLRWLALYPTSQAGWFDPSRWPRLHDMAGRLEQSAAMARAAEAEGLGPNPLTAPRHATPPEGSAT